VKPLKYTAKIVPNWRKKAKGTSFEAARNNNM
jgi:hypothetical protein